MGHEANPAASPAAAAGVEFFVMQESEETLVTVYEGDSRSDLDDVLGTDDTEKMEAVLQRCTTIISKWPQERIAALKADSEAFAGLTAPTAAKFSRRSTGF